MRGLCSWRQLMWVLGAEAKGVLGLVVGKAREASGSKLRWLEGGDSLKGSVFCLNPLESYRCLDKDLYGLVAGDL